MIIVHAINETAINEIAIKLNMSNTTLFALFNFSQNSSSINDTSAVNITTINASHFYNRTEIDEKIQTYNHTLQDINLTVNIGLARLISSLLDTYVNASVSNASQKISPIVAILRDDMNIRFDALKNVTVRNYQLERNISELSQNITLYAFNAAENVRYNLNDKMNWNLTLAFLMSVFFPVAIYLATTRIYNLRMKILGSVPELRRYAIEDLNLSPVTREEIVTRKNLKLQIIRTKCRPNVMKTLLDKVDNNEINNEGDIADYMSILSREGELKNESNNKHQVKQSGKGKHK